nr:tetratricopeptide repeat protein [Helicobacter suis]
MSKNYSKAIEYYQKAADMGNAFACNNLGVMYENGTGVKRNKAIARQYYQKACNMGNKRGCENIKRLGR